MHIGWSSEIDVSSGVQYISYFGDDFYKKRHMRLAVRQLRQGVKSNKHHAKRFLNLQILGKLINIIYSPNEMPYMNSTFDDLIMHI